MRERDRGLGCLGVPGIVGLLAFLAFATTVPGPGVVIGIVAVAVVYLAIGIAMTLAKKGD
jgi:hypothetical protein